MSDIDLDDPDAVLEMATNTSSTFGQNNQRKLELKKLSSSDQQSNKENNKDGSYNSSRRTKRDKDKDRERKRKRSRHKKREHRRHRKRSNSKSPHSSRSSSRTRYRKHSKRSHRRKERNRSKDRYRGKRYHRRRRSRSRSYHKYKNKHNRTQNTKYGSNDKKKKPRFQFKKRPPSPKPWEVNQGKTIKTERFWDGFHWVEKIPVKCRDQKLLNETLKQRQVELTNLPIYLGLTEQDIINVVNKFMIANYLSTKNAKNPCFRVLLDVNKGSAICEMSSVEEGYLFQRNEQMKILGQNVQIKRVGENQFGQTITLQTMVTQAEKDAEAQAMAFLAVQKFTQKEYREELQLGRNNILTNESPILKISNLVDRDIAKTGKDQFFDDLQVEIIEQFEKFGRIKSLFVIRPKNCVLGAELGSVFIEFFKLKYAQLAYKKTLQKKYNEREIKMVYIDRQIYNEYFGQLNDNQYVPSQGMEEENSLTETEISDNDSSNHEFQERVNSPPPLPTDKQNLNKSSPLSQDNKGKKDEGVEANDDQAPPPLPVVNDGPPPLPVVNDGLSLLPMIDKELPQFPVPIEQLPICNEQPPPLPLVSQGPPPIPSMVEEEANVNPIMPPPISQHLEIKDQGNQAMPPPIPILKSDQESLINQLQIKEEKNNNVTIEEENEQGF